MYVLKYSIFSNCLLVRTVNSGADLREENREKSKTWPAGGFILSSDGFIHATSRRLKAAAATAKPYSGAFTSTNCCTQFPEPMEKLLVGLLGEIDKKAQPQ
jgi:hypothetical protein